jgi:hypothetical protein
MDVGSIPPVILGATRRGGGRDGLISSRLRRCDEPASYWPLHISILIPATTGGAISKRLCQRCHIIHDRPHHLQLRRVTYLLRRAVGDLFLGAYEAAATAYS